MTDYRNWISKLIHQYPTTLQEDIKLLDHVEASGSEYYWMYQYILIYRISCKSILDTHLVVSNHIIETLEKTKGDRYEFGVAMKDLQASSQSMDDYFSEDLVIMKQLSD